MMLRMKYEGPVEGSRPDWAVGFYYSNQDSRPVPEGLAVLWPQGEWRQYQVDLMETGQAGRQRPDPMASLPVAGPQEVEREGQDGQRRDDANHRHGLVPARNDRVDPEQQQVERHVHEPARDRRTGALWPAADGAFGRRRIRRPAGHDHSSSLML